MEIWVLYQGGAPNGSDVRILRLSDHDIQACGGTHHDDLRQIGSIRVVRADEYGEDEYPVITEGKYSGVIGHGGLVLTRVPIEIAQQRAAYYANLASENVEAVDNDLMKEQDRRMPINIDKQSRTTFGGKKS